jgi:L-amino acid N-acyltransferase YncA
MPTDVRLRPAEAGDLAAIAAIYTPEVLEGTATFELEPPDAAELGVRLAKVRALGLPWLVAEAGGRIAGYAYAAMHRDRPAYRFTVEDSIYIDPTMHRRGVGRALLERLLVEAEKEGFRQMIAVIGDSNQAPSIELHKTAGFRMVGTFEAVGYKFGRWLDSVLMQKALGKGATTVPP